MDDEGAKVGGAAKGEDEPGASGAPPGPNPLSVEIGAGKGASTGATGAGSRTLAGAGTGLVEGTWWMTAIGLGASVAGRDDAGGGGATERGPGRDDAGGGGSFALDAGTGRGGATETERGAGGTGIEGGAAGATEAGAGGAGFAGAGFDGVGDEAERFATRSARSAMDERRWSGRLWTVSASSCALAITTGSGRFEDALGGVEGRAGAFPDGFGGEGFTT